MSSSGTRGLLGCINQYIDIVESFKHCAYHGLSTQIVSKSHPQRKESECMLPYIEITTEKGTKTILIQKDVLNVV